MVKMTTLALFAALGFLVALTPGADGQRFRRVSSGSRFPSRFPSRIPTRRPKPTRRPPVFTQPRPNTPPPIFQQTRPQPAGPGTAAPGTAAPGTAAPGTAAPGTAAPGTAAPGTAAPGTAAPGTAAPGTAVPGSAAPGTGSAPLTTPRGSQVTPSQPNSPEEQKKISFFQRVKEGCRKNTAECVFLAFDIGLTVVDFVRFGVELQIHSDRVAAEKLEFERRRNQTIEDQNVFLEQLENIQNGGSQAEDIDPNSVCEDEFIAAVNDGSPFFLCPLTANAEDEIRCCGRPGEQVCCTEQEQALDTSIFGDRDQPICTSLAIADINDGSPFFTCPLLENADNETECCGEPGEQVCCAPQE